MLSSRAALALFLGACLTGCNTARRNAERELASADSAVTALDQAASKILPERTGPIAAGLSTAKAAFEQGDYEAAIRGAGEVKAQAKEVADAVPARQAELSRDLQTLSEAMPRNLDSIKLRIDRAARTGQRPRGLSSEQFETVKQIHDSARQVWPGIKSMIDAGELAPAFAQAMQLRNRVSEALLALGLAADERAWGNLQTTPR